MNRFFTVGGFIGTLAFALFVGVAATYLFLGGGGKREEISVTIDEIKQVAKLATIDFHGTVTERVIEGHKWYEWKSAELFVEIHGTVEGLINLQKISMQASADKRSVTITIPPEAVEVSEPNIDATNGLKVTTLRDPNLFHKLTDKQRDEAVRHGLDQLKKKAIDSGIKARTLEEAKTAITHFLAPSGVSAKFITN